MTIIDTGTYGAKRQSTRKASPRDVLRGLLEKYPSKSERQLLQMFTETVRDDDAQIDAIMEYWFANNYRSLVLLKRDGDETSAQKAEKTARQASKNEEIKNIIKTRAAQMVLLDLTMPNGKALRDCTGKDCAKAGGWLANIAKTIKPTDVVGKVMSEAQVRKFWGR